MTRNQAHRANIVIDEYLQGRLSEEALEDCLSEVLEVPFVFIPEKDESAAPFALSSE